MREHAIDFFTHLLDNHKRLVALVLFLFAAFPFAAIVVMTMLLTGQVESPISVNTRLLMENNGVMVEGNKATKVMQRYLIEHQESQSMLGEKQIRLSLANCVNAAADAIEKRICTAGIENSEKHQRKLIERAIEKADQ